MSVLSLCSGYGGLDMALGLSVAAYAEVDKHAAKVMAHHHHVPNIGDITTVDWSKMPHYDWITGGFPCQPFSLAGKRQGENDARHLWPNIAEAIRVVQPGHVFLENVRSLLTLGFGPVVSDLAGMGYGVRWGVVRASDAGAPHRRARIFLLARTADAYRIGYDRVRDAGPSRWQEPAHHHCLAPDANSDGPQGAKAAAGQDAQRQGSADLGQLDRRRSEGLWGDYWPAVRRWERLMGRSAPWPTEPSRAGGTHLSARFVEWQMGLPDGHVTAVPGIPWTQQIKILGNGVVPQQARLALSLLGAEL